MTLLTPQDIDVPGATQVRWLSAGVITATRPATGRGRGHQRRYSERDAVVINLVKLLRNNGLSLNAVKRATRLVHDHLSVGKPLPRDCKLIVDGPVVSLCRTPGEWQSVLRNPADSGMRYIVDIGTLPQEHANG